MRQRCFKDSKNLKKYYKVLGDFLGIQPMRVKDPNPTTMSKPNVTLDEDTEDEEEPELVSI